MVSQFNLNHLEKNGINLNEFRKMCECQILEEKLKPSKYRKLSYKKWWKRFVKIQKKIALLNIKIRKLEEKI